MSEIKDFLYELLVDLNGYSSDVAVSVATAKIQLELGRINAKRDVTPVLVPELCYEWNGDMIFAAAPKKMRK